MQNKWDNEQRMRFYGIRKGDLVKYRGEIGEVVEYGFMDNNALYVKFNDKLGTSRCVAEWCEIITKVEDKNVE